MERFFDILFSTIALCFLSPVLLPVFLILRCTGEGEVFFWQERIGRDGRLFRLLKFATMLKDSPNIGTGTVTIKDDPRVLPVGRILRKTKINELPQLINIWRGEMSVVGPRPLTLQTFRSYSDETQENIKRVRPGLSGIGSIIFRDEEEILRGSSASVDFYNDTIAPYKGCLEVWFVLNKSLYVYFTAIFVTLWVVIFPKSKIAWKVFSSLPAPPPELAKDLHFSD